MQCMYQNHISCIVISYHKWSLQCNNVGVENVLFLLLAKIVNKHRMTVHCESAKKVIGVVLSCKQECAMLFHVSVKIYIYMIINYELSALLTILKYDVLNFRGSIS